MKKIQRKGVQKECEKEKRSWGRERERERKNLEMVNHPV